MPSAIKVLLADHHIMLREGLNCLLAKDNRFTVVGTADSSDETPAAVKESKPDIVVMDFSFLGVASSEAFPAFKETARVVLLGEGPQAGQIRYALQEGASGVVTKTSAYSELTEAIETVQRGERYLSEELTAVIINEVASSNEDPASKYESLTKREKMVFRMLVSGSTPQEIASDQGISPKTVHKHRGSLMEKLGITNTVQLVKFAQKMGIVVE